MVGPFLVDPDALSGGFGNTVVWDQSWQGRLDIVSNPYLLLATLDQLALMVSAE